MAPRSKDSRIRLQEPLATDFAAFRIALGHGASEIGIIREAVRAYIDAKIKNKAFRERFEAERAKLMAEKVQPLRIVRNGDEPR